MIIRLWEEEKIPPFLIPLNCCHITMRYSPVKWDANSNSLVEGVWYCHHDDAQISYARIIAIQRQCPDPEWEYSHMKFCKVDTTVTIDSSSSNLVAEAATAAYLSHLVLQILHPLAPLKKVTTNSESDVCCREKELSVSSLSIRNWWKTKLPAGRGTFSLMGATNSCSISGLCPTCSAVRTQSKRP